MFAKIDGALKLPEVLLRGIDGSSSNQLWFDELIRDEHVLEFLAAELPDHQPGSRLVLDKPLMFEEREGFPYGSTAHPQSPRDPDLDKWFTCRDFSLQNRFLDR